MYVCMISIRNNLRVSSSSSHNLIVKLNATKYAIKIDDRLFTHHALCRLPPLCAHSANCPAHTLCCVCVLQQTHSGQRVRNILKTKKKTVKWTIWLVQQLVRTRGGVTVCVCGSAEIKCSSYLRWPHDVMLLSVTRSFIYAICVVCVL